MVNEDMSVVKRVKKRDLKVLSVSRISSDGSKFYNEKLKESVC